NLEHREGGFNFCESCLILAKPGPVGAVSEFAFKISQSSVQLVDAMKVEPPVKPRCEANDGNERGDNRNDKEYDSGEERGQPERRVALPEARAGAVKCLRRWRQRQIIGLLGGKFTESIKGAGCPVHLAHSFQQQILQGGVKIFSQKLLREASRSTSESGMSRVKLMIPRDNTRCFSPGTVLAMASACATFINRSPGPP